MRIYVASSWRNNYQQSIVEALRVLGHEVYDFKNPPHGKGGFAWGDIDTNWEDWNTSQYVKALRHPVAEAGFNSDFDGMKWADICVMVLPCGRSANTEAGWMKGAGKKVIVHQPIKQEPELMYKLYDAIASDLWSLEYAIKMLARDLPGTTEFNEQNVELVRTGRAAFGFSAENQSLIQLHDLIKKLCGVLPSRPYFTGYYSVAPDGDIYLVSHAELVPATCKTIFQFRHMFKEPLT